MEPSEKPFAKLPPPLTKTQKAPTLEKGLSEDTAQSLPTFHHAATTSMNNPYVQIPLNDYHRLVARLENANRGNDSMKNLNTVIENLKVDLENHKDKAAKYETAFIEAELRCGQLIKSSLAKQGTKSIRESIVPSISTENPSIATDKLLANLMSENNALKEELDKFLQQKGLDYSTFKSTKAAETEIEELHKSLEKEKERCRELSSLLELKSTGDADDQLQARCSELTQQVWKLTKSSTAKQALITAFNTEHTRVTLLADSLRTELEQSKHDVVALKNKLAAMQADKDKLAASNDKLNERLMKILQVKSTGTVSQKEKELGLELDRQRQISSDNERMAMQCQEQMNRQQLENEKMQKVVREETQKRRKAEASLKQSEQNWASLQQMVTPPSTGHPVTGHPKQKLSLFEQSEAPYRMGQDVVADMPGLPSSKGKERRKSRDKASAAAVEKCPRCYQSFKSHKDLEKHIKKCLDE